MKMFTPTGPAPQFNTSPMLVMTNERQSDYTAVLRVLNIVFDGFFTKVVREDATSYFVLDNRTQEVCKFSKKEIGV